MREIKFRIWFKNFNRYMREDEKVEHLMDITNGKIVCNIDDVEYNGDEPDYYTGGSITEQYTGLKDKNGVEIYEGDIVKYDNGFNDCYSISYNNKECRYEIGEFIGLNNNENILAIGNIHENKGLL